MTHSSGLHTHIYPDILALAWSGSKPTRNLEGREAAVLVAGGTPYPQISVHIHLWERVSVRPAARSPRDETAPSSSPWATGAHRGPALRLAPKVRPLARGQRHAHGSRERRTAGAEYLCGATRADHARIHGRSTAGA